LNNILSKIKFYLGMFRVDKIKKK